MFEQRACVVRLLRMCGGGARLNDALRWAVDEVRQRAFALVTSKQFEHAIRWLLLLSIVALASTWYEQPTAVDKLNNFSNSFFFAAFTVEMVLKLLGLGSRQYFASRWNTFEFSVVTSWIASDLLELIIGEGMPVRAFMMLRCAGGMTMYTAWVLEKHYWFAVLECARTSLPSACAASVL